jgi:hypothetical protein
MILAWQLARGVIWLKRLAKAQERIAEIAREQWLTELSRHPVRTAPKPMEISVASVEEWNQRWEDEHPDASVEG